MSRAGRISGLFAAASVVVVVAAAAGAAGAYRHQAASARAAALPFATYAATPHPANLSVSKHYIGVFEPGVPASYQPVRGFTGATGTQPDIVVYYSGWHDPFQARFATEAQKHGAVTLVQMEPRGATMASIAAGKSDRYLHRYAAAVRSFGGQVILSFAPEMNGPWYTWGYRHTSPAVFVAAWRHVVDLFRAAGAVNVTWLWTVNRANAGVTGPLKDGWPGAGYVTWVGIDGYYFQRSDSFLNVFAPTIAQVRELTSKPVLLSEAAAGPVAGKVPKIPDLFTGIRQFHLLGLIWFDVRQNDGLFHQDWRLESNPAAVAVFRHEASSYR